MDKTYSFSLKLAPNYSNQETPTEFKPDKTLTEIESAYKG